MTFHSPQASHHTSCPSHNSPVLKMKTRDSEAKASCKTVRAPGLSSASSRISLPWPISPSLGSQHVVTGVLRNSFVPSSYCLMSQLSTPAVSTSSLPMYSKTHCRWLLITRSPAQPNTSLPSGHSTGIYLGKSPLLSQHTPGQVLLWASMAPLPPHTALWFFCFFIVY